MADVSTAHVAATFDGVTAEALAATLDVPRVAIYGRIASTMDAAHALGADGAPAGTLVIADEQTSGRGRAGRRWHSEPGGGLWLTLLERPNDPVAVQVLSLRLGLRAAAALDAFARAPIRLKWPNDLFVESAKVAGVLVEARWRGERPDWVAIGFGINLRAPAELEAASLLPGVTRVEVLAALVPALRAAAAGRGMLAPREVGQYAARDLARGRRCDAPLAGVVQGIAEDGALRIATADGERRVRDGSLVLREDS